MMRKRNLGTLLLVVFLAASLYYLYVSDSFWFNTVLISIQVLSLLKLVYERKKSEELASKEFKLSSSFRYLILMLFVVGTILFFIFKETWIVILTLMLIIYFYTQGLYSADKAFSARASDDPKFFGDPDYPKLKVSDSHED